MGKKIKRKQIKNHPRKKDLVRLGVAAAVLIGSVGVWAWVGTRTPSRIANNASMESGYARRETGTPLSPALFVGQTARAYQIAHEIPDVLDQLYCYCECDKHSGHRSLLSCFIDSHAAT